MRQVMVISFNPLNNPVRLELLGIILYMLKLKPREHTLPRVTQLRNGRVRFQTSDLFLDPSS